MASTTQKLLTYEEWLKLPPVEDGTDEVVKGELRFMPPTHYPHAEIIRRTARSLDQQLDEAFAIVLASNFGLLISRDPLTCRSPDLAVYKVDRLVIKDGLYVSPPDLVVEVLSPSESKRRKQEKLDDYASIGVPEAWVLSYEARSAEVFELSEGRLRSSKVIVAGDLQPTRFPGVHIPLAAVWPD